MRHRGEGTGTGKTVVKGVTGTFARITDLLSEEESPTGRHKQPVRQSVIPAQKTPTHETLQGPETEVAPQAVPEVETVAEVVQTVETVETAKVQEPDPQVTPARPLSTSVPVTAQWKAGHGARVFAAALLVLAVGGTSALGLRYAETHGSDEFLSTVVGLAVIVGLWALLIASTPQVISLRGSVLTVRNSSGTELFDLADGLHPVDVVGEPRSSNWAVLLHRPNNTSVVLRRRDVDAVALDPIVRHYRDLAEQRRSDRQARFDR
jgi:hypothetical protein